MGIGVLGCRDNGYWDARGWDSGVPGSWGVGCQQSQGYRSYQSRVSTMAGCPQVLHTSGGCPQGCPGKGGFRVSLHSGDQDSLPCSASTTEAGPRAGWIPWIRPIPLTRSGHAAVHGVPGARGPTGSRPRAPGCRGWFIRGRVFLIWFGWVYFWEPVAWQWARDARGHTSPPDRLSAPIAGMGSGGRASHPATLGTGARALQGENSQPEQDFGGMEKMGTPSGREWPCPGITEARGVAGRDKDPIPFVPLLNWKPGKGRWGGGRQSWGMCAAPLNGSLGTLRTPPCAPSPPFTPLPTTPPELPLSLSRGASPPQRPPRALPITLGRRMGKLRHEAIGGAAPGGFATLRSALGGQSLALGGSERPIAGLGAPGSRGRSRVPRRGGRH